MKNKKNLILLLLILIFTINLFSATCNINGNTTYQTISGFGASSAWSEWSGCSCGTNSFLVNNAAQFFSTTNGIGLSIIRARIPPDQGQWSSTLAPLQAARDQGVTLIMATAWTPPAAWKSNGAVDNSNGAYLLPQYYQNYADYLVNYVNTLRNNNVNLYAISPANEPDYQVSYDGCSWSGAQLRDFIKNNLGPTFASNNITTKILVPESYRNDCSYADTILGDATARNYVFGIAQHFYGGGPTFCTAAGTYNKEFWQTERSSFEAYDATMTHGLTTAGWIHNCLVNANYNAFLYWWLAADQNNEGLRGVNNGVPKRFWVMGNFSKFIRPGFIRIAADANPATNVNVSAYKSSNSGTYVIVAINRNTSATSVTFSLSNVTATSFTPWITSSSYDLSQQAAVSVSGGSFTYNLPAQSVVSFVGSGVVGTATRTPTNTPYAGTPTFTRSPTSTPVSVLLDDMEDGNTTNNWGGAWYSYSGTGTTITPKPFVMTAGGMTGSALYRAQIQATVADYAGMGTNLNPSETAVNLTSYTAVEFWVMGNGGTYWFQFTQPSITDGDHFGVTFTAPATWTKVTVPIDASALSQRGFGAASTFTPGSIIALQWASYSNGALDIRIDNVQFLTYNPPTPTRTQTSVMPSATNTPTRTRTSTATWTRTNTQAITNTFTATQTRTVTTTSTRTGTPTYTRTNTQVITNTFTGTQTRTVTATSTRTTSPSSSVTVSFSNTATATWTLTRTATQTSTATPTLTYTGTPTRTNSPSVSASPSNTVMTTVTWTSTRTATLTFTRTPSLTYTGTGTRTNTTTSTPISSGTPTGTNTPVSSPTFTPSRTSSSTYTNTASPTFTSTSTRTATSTWTRTISPTHSISPTITQTPTGIPPSPTNTIVIVPTGTITAIGTYTRTNTSTSTATWTSTRTATQTFTATQYLTYTGTMTQTYTSTSTITVSYTRTNTPNYSATSTPTGTQPTSTNTPTRTVTQTLTYTRTRTSTSTTTDTITRTNTPTFTFTQTTTNTSTNTATGTSTMTRTVTRTWTMTATLSWTQTVTTTITNTPSITATYTVTPTFTGTVIPDKEEYKIEDVVIMPNPYIPGKRDIKIGFEITQASKVIKVRIYTSGFRLIKQIAQVGNYVVGRNTIEIESRYLKNLANGTYYIVITAINNKGVSVNSKPVTLIILK
jgi:O-glycosyl hydrolase